MARSFKLKILALTICFAFMLMGTATVGADIADLTIQTGCTQEPSYTGALSLQTKDYDVYVRLAKRGEQAAVQGYAQSKSYYGDCVNLGMVQATGDRWTKLGLYEADSTETVIQLAGVTLANIPDANRPSIMLVPHENPPCIPDIECFVEVEGLQGYVRPVGTLLNQNSLHVVEVKNPAQERVKKVRYYLDGKLVNTTDTLQPFDTRYFVVPEQKLSRVIEYSSNQWVILESSVPENHFGTFSNFLYSLFQRSPTVIKYVLWAAGLLLIWTSILATIRHYIRRRNRLLAHGFIKRSEPNTFVKQLYRIEASRKFRLSIVAIKGIVLVGVTVVVITSINSFVVALSTVEGMSMQKKYFTGDVVLVNKIPKTFANINGLEYVPGRGDVVIVRSAFGNAPLKDSETEVPLLIKRVIALPGERVVMKEGKLLVYNEENPLGFSPDKGSEWENGMTPDIPTTNLDIKIGLSELFLSGDNRPESIDSRFNGPIALKEVIGTVVMRLWPTSR